jgi:D-methionine transport system substrate-binding protein
MKKIILLFTLIAIFIGCGKKEVTENNVLRIGASPSPHVEILEIIKDDLAKEGIQLEIVEFTDYVTPNQALNDGEIDANFFQHLPYLEAFSKDRGLGLSSVGGVFVSPLSLFSDKIKDIKELQDGATIAIPNDPSNGGRALIILEKTGLIKLDPKAGLKATVLDIVENPKQLNFKELDAAQLPRSLQDVDCAFINGNYALDAGIDPVKDAILREGKDSPYSNIIAVKTENKGDKKIEALMKALHSEKVKNFIIDKYKGIIAPTF